MNFDERLKELNLVLPAVSAPKGLYKPLVVAGDLAYLSGHLPSDPGGNLIVGVVGDTLTPEEGKAAARAVGMAILATLQHELGSLNRIGKVVKLFGMVNAVPGFDKHPFVINGCSELMQEIFGPELGVGARSAFGVAGLPMNCPVEIEAIFELAK